MSEETWKEIDGSHGNYLVSNLGRVKTIKRQGTNERFLSGYKHNGYMFVNLRIDGKYKMVAVHRLVANAFIPNPFNLPCVNHKDENKSNNIVENLEWCTVQYNNNYGTARQRAAMKKYRPCEGVWSDGTKKQFNSCTIAARKTGLTQGNIWNACANGHMANGIKWRFLDGKRGRANE